MKIGIAGLGLIGGSLALALREAHDVIGYDSDERVRAAAKRGSLAVASRLESLVPADAVLVATPVGAIVPTLERLEAAAGDAVMIDTGSLKAPVYEYAQRSKGSARIVGGHPMAGSTSAGYSAADADLFRGRPFLLVPTARSDDAAMAVAGKVARAVGATVTVCSADVHDHAMARLIAAPLASAAALAVAGADAEPLLRAAGPGFRDSTRLAETPPEFALDLLFGNAETGAAIDAVIGGLEQLRERIRQDDRDYVRSFVLTAASVRRELE